MKIWSSMWGMPKCASFFLLAGFGGDLFVVVLTVLILGAPIAYLIFKHRARKERIRLFEGIATVLEGTLEPDGVEGEPEVRFSLEEVPAKLTYYRHRVTLYTQLILNVASESQFIVVMAPQPEPEDESGSVLGVVSKEVLGAFNPFSTSSTITKLLVDKSRGAAYDSQRVRLFDSHFDYRFIILADESSRARIMFAQELRDHLFDFCRDLDDFNLYVHIDERIVISKMENLEDLDQIQRFVDLGRHVLTSYQQASRFDPID